MTITTVAIAGIVNYHEDMTQLVAAPTGNRCPAAHHDDPSPCDGPTGAVRVVDMFGGQAHGCIHHGATLLASLESGRIYPGPARVAGAAADAYQRAQGLAPFAFENEPSARQCDVCGCNPSGDAAECTRCAIAADVAYERSQDR
jgi:hypothetical protein